MRQWGRWVEEESSLDFLSMYTVFDSFTRYHSQWYDTTIGGLGVYLKYKKLWESHENQLVI